MTISLRAHLFYTGMKLFFGWVLPPEMPLETYRKASNQPFLDWMPRGIRREDGEVSGIPGEWITPANVAPDRLLLYLHGGGYVLKTPQVHRVMVGRLAQATGCRAFMADYRLAPEYPFPAALDDATSVYRGLIAEGFMPSRIVVAGESAGGGLTAALLINLRDAGDPLPAAACLISALLDCTFSDDSITVLQKQDPFLRLKDVAMMERCYYGDQDPQNPLISPVFADLHGLPPLLVHAAEHEILRTEAIRFVEKAIAAGVDTSLQVWDGMIHAFPLFAGLVPEGKTAITKISAFFRKHLD